MQAAVVALRKESVDRNYPPTESRTFREVALRKESVDRNTSHSSACLRCWASLSARRAWIEIEKLMDPLATALVALRKESVDRNHDDMLRYRDAERRSPQGERG